MTRPLRRSAAALSLAFTTMVLAATHPQAVSTPVVGLAALVFHNTATNPAADAMADVFDFKAFQTDTDTVLSVGGGSDDAAILAELLDSTDPSHNVFHVNYEFDAHAKVQVLTVFTDTDALPTHDAKRSVDQSGGVDCAGATICHTDPRTHTTTITYPDGVVAIVERINDLAVVASNALGAAVLGHLLPAPAHTDAPAPAASPPPSSPPTNAAPAPEADPGSPPVAPAAVSTGPRLNVVRPAPDFTPGRPGASTTSPGTKSDLSDTTDRFVNDVLNQVSDTVNRLIKRPGAHAGVGEAGSPAPSGEE
jgi:hypothetical protein